MRSNELRLAAELLRLAADQFSNHGCNDFDLPKEWTQGECDQFMLEMLTWNGSPEEHEPGIRGANDWFVMGYLAHRLESAAHDEAHDEAHDASTRDWPTPPR